MPVTATPASRTTRRHRAFAAAPRPGCGPRGRLPGSALERLGVRPPVVFSQDFARFTGPIRNGAVTDLASHDRKMRNGHGEAAGTCVTHHLHNASPAEPMRTQRP